MSEIENEVEDEVVAHHEAEADVLKRLRVANTGLATGDPRMLQAVVTLIIFLKNIFNCDLIIRVQKLV